MTNLEYYKDEIKKRIKNDENFGCAICKAKFKNCQQCSGDDGDDILCSVVDWLLEEHKEPIKLKQWEKDLISLYDEDDEVYSIDYNFDSFLALIRLKEKGYFKGITDTSMKIEDILKNCEVVE